MVLENIDCKEEQRSITQIHTEGKMVINLINLSFYTDIIDKKFIYYLLDIEDGEESANVSGSSTNENKREESGVAPNEDHSEGKIEIDLVLLMVARVSQTL